MRLKCWACFVVIASAAIAQDIPPPKWNGNTSSPSNSDYTTKDLNDNVNNSTDIKPEDEEVIDSILQTGKQGRNLDGFDEVYSDPDVQDALQNGDDIEARNVIRDKLCDLGLMDCGVQIQQKRPYYGPPPPPGFNRKPPQNNGPYGPPRPMPPPNNKYNGPPRKVGYAYGSGQIYQNKPENPPLPPIFEGPIPPGPVYQGSIPSGPSYENNLPPYKFISGNEQYQQKYELDSHGLSRPILNGNSPSLSTTNQAQSGTSNTLNIHHHYHHLDNEGVKTGSSILNKQQYGGGGNGLISSEYASNTLTSGGFIPVSAGYDLKNQQQSGSFGSTGIGFSGVNSGLGPVNGISGSGIYGGVSSKPIFEPVNQLSSGGFNSGSNLASVNSQYGQSGTYNGNGDSSFHSTNPDYYKKALNTNSALPNYLQSYSQALYTPQYNGQFSTQTNSVAAGTNANKYKPQYNGQTSPNQLSQNNVGVKPQYSYVNGQTNNFGQTQNFAQNSGDNYQSLSSSQLSLDCVCVPYDQCPSVDIIGRKGDLILPLDPRHLETEIEALDEETVLTNANGTMTIVRVPKNVILNESSTSTNKSIIIESMQKSNSTHDEKETKKISKREAAEKQADVKADGEGVSYNFIC